MLLAIFFSVHLQNTITCDIEWEDCEAKLPLYKALMSYPVRSHTFQGRGNQVLQEILAEVLQRICKFFITWTFYIQIRGISDKPVQAREP